MKENYLSQEDIQKLLASPLDKKMGVTTKIAKFYDAGNFDPDQMAIAEQIFRALIRDSEVEVRKTLAEAIKSSEAIPKDVVLELAKDINEVSIPILEFSEILTDNDLIEIIQSTSDAKKQASVSKRKEVSPKVSDALIETGSEVVVDTLLQNRGAKVSEKGMEKIVEEFSESENLIESLVTREKLPVNVVENVTNKVSNEIIRKLEAKYGQSIAKIGEHISSSRDAATMKVMGLHTTDQEYYLFCQSMRQLNIDEKLMPISALCIGNLNLFEICVARTLKVPVANIRTLLMDTSNKGFRVLYERAGLPESLYQATEALVGVLREISHDLQSVGITLSKNTAHKIITNLMMRSEELGKVDNIDYLITLIRHHAQMDKPAA